MTDSNRTPEGFPIRCSVCGDATKFQHADTAPDARCPQCGQLLWRQTITFTRVQQHFAAAVLMPGRDGNETALPQFERRQQSRAPQFSVRLLLVILTTCATAFAMLSAQLHDYLNIAAAMIIMFWMGTALAFAGLVMDRHGDLWFAPASLAESIGLGTIVVASFTGMYYGAMFVLVAITMLV